MSDLPISVSNSGFVGKEVEPTSTNETTDNKATDNKALTTAQSTLNNSVKDSTDTDPRRLEDKELRSIVNEVNEKIKLSQPNFSLTFSIDGETGQQIVKVIDKESDEVIRQIPSEELVVLRKKMDELTGILFDEQV